jgi:hypothetical protein
MSEQAIHRAIITPIEIKQANKSATANKAVTIINVILADVICVSVILNETMHS